MEFLINEKNLVVFISRLVLGFSLVFFYHLTKEEQREEKVKIYYCSLCSKGFLILNNGISFAANY